MAQIVAGTRAPGSYCASFRAARMLAAISSTRLRPSSIEAVYQLRFVFAIASAGRNQVEGAVLNFLGAPESM
jgi:hypothetical protein